MNKLRLFPYILVCCVRRWTTECFVSAVSRQSSLGYAMTSILERRWNYWKKPVQISSGKSNSKNVLLIVSLC